MYIIWYCISLSMCVRVSKHQLLKSRRWILFLFLPASTQLNRDKKGKESIRHTHIRTQIDKSSNEGGGKEEEGREGGGERKQRSQM